jgi:broad-specificity NMP kinase
MSGRYEAFNKGKKNYKKKIDKNKNIRVNDIISKFKLSETIDQPLFEEDRFSPHENKRMRYTHEVEKKPRCDSCGSMIDERISPSEEILKARKEYIESRMPSPEDEEISEYFSKQCTREKEVLDKKIDIKLVNVADGKEFKPVELPPKELVEITFTDEIINVKDIIRLSKMYPADKTKEYSIDLHKLNNIVPHLEELDSMIGMNDIKSNIVSQLMYFLQGFPYTHMLHTVIEGPPGVGKTCLGKILGNIYLDMKCINNCKVSVDLDEDSSMNMKKMLSTLLTMRDEELPKSKFKIVKRSDLIGQHVGSTAIRTQKIINDSFGGVLFIDEAYSLAGDDAFSKECINTLNQNLSENGDKFICILAGYPNGLNSLFEMNSGLNRRFPFRYKINKYDPKELYNILKNKMDKDNLKIDALCDLEKFIKENYESFPNFGGDIETLLFHIKIMHSKRVFGKLMKYRSIITKEDIDNAMVVYKTNTKEEEKYKSMYQ